MCKDIPFSQNTQPQRNNFHFPVYLSQNATLMVKAFDNGNEYGNHLQGGTPPDRSPARSGKLKRNNANHNSSGWS